MPNYSFQCRSCEKVFEELADHDPKGRYRGVKCPGCGSGRKRQLLTACRFIFANPEGTAKFEDTQYKFEYKLDKAKDERRAAETASHMGMNPYHGEAQIAADINNDSNYAEVK